MVVTFVSNYINHHQLPFCKAMSAMEGVEFHFVQTQPMEQKRVEMGWAVDEKSFPFVSLYYEDQDNCRRLILESDVTILGWTEGLISDIEEQRLSSGKLTFRVSERIYREGQWKFVSPNGLKAKYREHIKYRKQPVYLMCAGAYVASDFDLIHSYPGKRLKWGYFPEVSKKEPAKLSEPVPKTIRLCWAGRLIELKHPEYVVKAARALKDKDYSFTLDIIGDGYLTEELKRMIKREGLETYVKMQGAKSPSEVKDYMRESDIFLFTSNYLEGWGAVVNEAMGSGCAVIASGEAGAVPFLMEDGVNGFVYKKSSLKDLTDKLLYLFENRGKIRELGSKARTTIIDTWNAEHAALEFVRFCREFRENGAPTPAEEGPMSEAEVLKPAGIIRSFQEKNRLE